jgi:hypothetical protein
MTTIKYNFSLSQHTGFPPPAVAAAIDVNANEVADPGESILLSQNGLTWSGEHPIEGSADGLVVSSLFLAKLGARYAIKITDENGKLLAQSEDTVDKAPQIQFVMLVAP